MCLCNMPQPSCYCTVLSTPDFAGGEFITPLSIYTCKIFPQRLTGEVAQYSSIGMNERHNRALFDAP